MAITQPLSVVCNVAVSVSPVAAATPTFNQGLIVGPSTIIPALTGTLPRIRQYTSLAGMSSDGFTTAHPEFLAAQLYFTQTGTYPSNAYAAAAAMGVAIGLNTGLANSNFTMKFKVLTGAAAEPLTATQIGTIEGLNGNLYLNYANTYNWLEPGVTPNGQF